MAKCRTSDLARTISLNQLNKEIQLHFSVLTDNQSCVGINTKNYTTVDADTRTYNTYRVPGDLFNCLPEGCTNSGTLLLTRAPEGENGVTASYKLSADATQFAAGIVTFYVYFEAAGTYNLTFDIADIADTANADSYTKSITVERAGFVPVLIDLSKAPESEVGTGWEPTNKGVDVKVNIVNADASGGTTAGLSSFYFYNSLEDFENNDTVTIGCLTEAGGDTTVDPLEAQCIAAGYDDTSVAAELTITGTQVSANWWKLNPLMDTKLSVETGWVAKVVDEVITETTIDGVRYGTVQLDRLSTEECGFISASLSDFCIATDALLNRVNSPVLLALGEREFLVLNGEHTDPALAGQVLFNELMIGQAVRIVYPQTVEAEVRRANDKNLNQKRTRLSIPMEFSDGTFINRVYPNVLVTSFPGSMTTDQVEFTFTISIQPDKDGNRYIDYRERL